MSSIDGKLLALSHVGIQLRLRHARLHGGDLFQHVVVHLEHGINASVEVFLVDHPQRNGGRAMF